MSAVILLINPKYPHNVAQVIRACAAYGAHEVVFTGERMLRKLEAMDRIPREERMKGYSKVKWRHIVRPFDEFEGLGYIPVCVEVRQNSEMLPAFVHPPVALYVFGPEDGSIGSVVARHCHRFLAIPTDHCINLSMAVGTVLYDRRAKRQPDYRMDMALTENRGYVDE